ncbi:hypothetical protein DFS34DRAFT_364990, partial [Phlyctochytrium arcticum]
LIRGSLSHPLPPSTESLSHPLQRLPPYQSHLPSTTATAAMNSQKFNLSHLLDKPILTLNRTPAIDKFKSVHLSPDETLYQAMKLYDIERKISVELKALKLEFVRKIAKLDFSKCSTDSLSTSVMKEFRNSDIFKIFSDFPEIKERFDTGLRSRKLEYLTADQMEIDRLKAEITRLLNTITNNANTEDPKDKRTRTEDPKDKRTRTEDPKDKRTRTDIFDLGDGR